MSILERTQCVRRWILKGEAQRCLQALESGDAEILRAGMRPAPVVANVAVFVDPEIAEFCNAHHGRATTVFNALIARDLGEDVSGKGSKRVANGRG
ncbi:MAG: hypothetical protein ACP5M3_06380 [Acidithiobacillus sp.]